MISSRRWTHMRTGPGRLLIPILVLAAVSVLFPVIGSSSGSAAGIIGGKVHATFNPIEGKVFILVIGNDARTGNPDETRADAMHIIGINPKTLKAGILNFPRDSYVSVPGHGSMKMNESLYAGGPDLLVKTIEQETGIQIDYWVMTGFEGFRHIVHNLGGVTVDVPYAIDDYGSGANLKKGVQVLDPEQALAFNRSRKTLPAGDIDRTGNQGLFLLSLLKQLHNETDAEPAAVLKWIGTTRKWARFDIPPDEMFRLGVLATQISPSEVKSVTVPASIGAVGLASVVFISPGAESLYRRFEKNGSL